MISLPATLAYGRTLKLDRSLALREGRITAALAARRAALLAAFSEHVPGAAAAAAAGAVKGGAGAGKSGARAVVRALVASERFPPQGAYYFFPSLQRFIGLRRPPAAAAAAVSSLSSSGGVIRDDDDLATYLMETAGVVVIPGSCFGAPGFFRIAYAAMEPAEISAGVAAMGRALAALLPPTTTGASGAPVARL